MFQRTIQAAIHVTQNAEMLIQSKHYNVELIRSIADNIDCRWRQLMCDTEECQKLVTASINWFKTAEQVCEYVDTDLLFGIIQTFVSRLNAMVG